MRGQRGVGGLVCVVAVLGCLAPEGRAASGDESPSAEVAVERKGAAWKPQGRPAAEIVGTALDSGKLRERLQGASAGSVQGAADEVLGVATHAPALMEGISWPAARWQAAWQALSPQDQAELTAIIRGAVDATTELTPEQKHELNAAAEQMAQQLQSLSPEGQEAFTHRLTQSAQAYASLPHEQREAILAQATEAVSQMRQLTPEQHAVLTEYYKTQLGL